MKTSSPSFVATDVGGNRTIRRQKLRSLRDRRNSSLAQKIRLGRNLSYKPSYQKPSSLTTYKQQYKYKLLFLVMVAVSLLTLYCTVDVYKPQILTGFITKYTSQYMSIIHNKIDYCDRDVNLSEMFGKISQRVLHQDVALRQLEMAMHNQTNARAIALVGSSGVGKSLTARLLREHFPWSENVHTFQWNTHISDDTHKYQRVRDMIAHMSLCGRNLLIIDNMTPCDHEFVTLINRLIMNVQTKQKDDIDDIEKQLETKEINTDMYDNKDLTILYIFNMNKMLSPDRYDEQYAQLQELPNTTIINYHNFGQNELADCIRHELIFEEMIMSEDNFNDLLVNTAVAESGCKTIHSKIMIAGKHKPMLAAEQSEQRLDELRP